jgi:DNA sulfur modification protein DndB
MTGIEFHLPAIQGLQAGRHYYLAMCPINLMGRILPLGKSETRLNDPLPHKPDASRASEFSKYVASNLSNYAMSSITCVIDRQVRFDPMPGQLGGMCAGTLRVPMSARVVILEGLDRRAGIEAALERNPELGDETISIVFFVDPGFARAEQVLSDLRRHNSKSSRSQGIMCDSRDDIARISREVVRLVDAFSEMTEMARSTISNRSLKLFTLSGIYHANTILLSGKRIDPFDDRLATAVEFWREVSLYIPAWQLAKQREISPAELRKTFVHSHAIALAGLARAGKALLGAYPKTWKRRIRNLQSFDWSRSNAKLWEGRAMIAGRLSKSSVSVVLTGNAIKTHLDISLTRDEEDAEKRMNGR